MTKQQKQIDKEFKLSSWAIANKTTIFVMISLILFLGISAYYSMPRESFPEIRETKIYVSSIYPGNTAEDVEKLIKNQEQNMTNKVNIEFLKQQLEKTLADVEQLKDKVRKNGNGH